MYILRLFFVVSIYIETAYISWKGGKRRVLVFLFISKSDRDSLSFSRMETPFLSIGHYLPW